MRSIRLPLPPSQSKKPRLMAEEAPSDIEACSSLSGHSNHPVHLRAISFVHRGDSFRWSGQGAVVVRRGSCRPPGSPGTRPESCREAHQRIGDARIALMSRRQDAEKPDRYGTPPAPVAADRRQRHQRHRQREDRRGGGGASPYARPVPRSTRAENRCCAKTTTTPIDPSEAPYTTGDPSRRSGARRRGIRVRRGCAKKSSGFRKVSVRRETYASMSF